MEDNSLQIVNTSALETITRAEIDMQISTAKKYPRDIHRTQSNVLALATIDQATAQGCFYSLKRGDNKIEGPSVRLAEIVASSWSNIRYGARVIGDDGKQLTAQGFCHDLETNNAVQIEVKVRITTKDGKRFSDDMIVMSGNSACAKALRNAIFKVVPMGVFNSIMSEIKTKATGANSGESVKARAEKAVSFFEKMGLTRERILTTIGKSNTTQIDEEDLVLLTGLKTALADKEITLEEAFPVPGKENQQARSNQANQAVQDKLDKK